MFVAQELLTFSIKRFLLRNLLNSITTGRGPSKIPPWPTGWETLC